MSHPNICTLFDIGQDDDVWFLVMEHLEGETLEARLARGPLPIGEACQLASGIAEALALAHSRGIVHRDLKPGNIMLTPDGVKILDFGLAKAWLAAVWPGAAPASGPDGTETLTVEGAVLGTPPYMSPEQLTGQDITAASDIFSFGSVLFEMVTGRRAFPGSTPAESVAKVLSERRPSLSDSAVGVPPALERLVSRCLAPSPDDRWPTMRAVVDTLHEIAATSSRRRNQTASRWRPGRATVAVGVIALAGIFEGIVLTVIDRLSLPEFELRVTSMSSAGRHRGGESDPEAVAAELDVDWLVTGRVFGAGDRLTSIVELVSRDGTDRRRVQTDAWTGADDPFVPRDIARAVLDALAVPVEETTALRLASLDTQNAAASRWYRQGRSALNRRDLVQALQSFTMATDEDPNFALARAGLARANALQGTMGWSVNAIEPPRSIACRST